MTRRTLKLFLLVLAVAGPAAAAEEDNAHLEGVDHLYMTVDTTEAPDILPNERLALSEIVELHLLRGEIDLRQFVLNQPDANIPLLRVRVDTASPASAGDFELILELIDRVTIDRNGERTVATTYTMRRSGNAPAGGNRIEGIKSELREMMTSFVEIFRRQNR